jgi:hypothetical protein
LKTPLAIVLLATVTLYASYATAQMAGKPAGGGAAASAMSMDKQIAQIQDNLKRMQRRKDMMQMMMEQMLQQQMMMQPAPAQ